MITAAPATSENSEIRAAGKNPLGPVIASTAAAPANPNK
jgi:hypothetical protein